MSFRDIDDDEIPIAVEYNSGVEEEVEETDFSSFLEKAISVQRLAVTRLQSKHVRGRMEVAIPDPTRKGTVEKLFRLNKLIQWDSGDPVVVVDELRKGRVRARVSAATGLGKSTKLPCYVAKELDYRVLYVSLDADALQQVDVYINANNMGRFRRTWPTKKGNALCCMTYADFNGYMTTLRRSTLFAAFDVIVFDEAFVNSGDVAVACSNFAVFANPDISLLCCSATIRTDFVAEQGGSQGLGSFRELTMEVSLDDAIAGGKLADSYLVDNAMVVLPTDQMVSKLYAYYERIGADVRFLDSASDYDDIDDVNRWMDGDSSTPRVVVCHSRFSIAFNLRVAYVILFPYQSGFRSVDREVKECLFPMTDAMVLQSKSRTGRGILKESGGLIMSPARSDATAVLETDVVPAFVKLCAAGIRPLREGKYAAGYKIFPEGLSSEVAITLTKVCMLPEVVSHYLGTDGYIVERYARALNIFAQPDHYLQPGDDAVPLHRDAWFEECVIGTNHKVKVPVLASGELQVMLHAIELIADGLIDVPRWRSSKKFSYGDGYDSDNEGRPPRVPVKDHSYRRIDDVKRTQALHLVTENASWAYDGPITAKARRVGGIFDSQRCMEALKELDASLIGYTIPRGITDVVEAPGGTVTPIYETMADGNVESPGGSVVCTIPANICEKMNVGEVLRPAEMEVVVFAARKDNVRFASSKLFDCFAGPWDACLDSLQDRDVVRWLIKRGLVTDAYALVNELAKRFNSELISVLCNSNVFKQTFFKIFNKLPSMRKVMSAIAKGEFDAVAQTSGFINRVRRLKAKIDSVLLYADSQGVYLPNYITSSQRSIPLRGEGILGYVGEKLETMPSSWRKALNGSTSTIDGRNRYLTNGSSS